MLKYARLSSTATLLRLCHQLLRRQLLCLLSPTAAVYVTSYPNLFTVKFLILTFFRLGNHFNIITQIISFLATSVYDCKQLNLHYLSTSFQFSFLAIVKSSFPRISILHSRQLYLAAQFNPSCTNATDQYCHSSVTGSSLMVLAIMLLISQSVRKAAITVSSKGSLYFDTNLGSPSAWLICFDGRYSILKL